MANDKKRLTPDYKNKNSLIPKSTHMRKKDDFLDSKKQKEKTKAAALSYDIHKDQAPVIVASGQGNFAERIIEKARKQDIPIEENQDIIDILVKLNIGEEVPAELYQAIAEILSFIYQLEEI